MQDAQISKACSYRDKELKAGTLYLRSICMPRLDPQTDRYKIYSRCFRSVELRCKSEKRYSRMGCELISKDFYYHLDILPEALNYVLRIISLRHLDVLQLVRSIYKVLAPSEDRYILGRLLFRKGGESISRGVCFLGMVQAVSAYSISSV
jgi:hypothetical protein